MEELSVPELSIPASRQECIAVADVLRNHCSAKVEHLSSREADLRLLLEQCVVQMRKTLGMMEEVVEKAGWIEYSHHDNDVRELTTYRQELRHASAVLPLHENLLLFFEREVALGYSCELQRHLMKMIKGQPDELKTWFFTEQCGGAHVSILRDCKPIVVLADKERSTIDSRFPPEIKSLIYWQLDLETCVVLRQANFSWYTAFQDNEKLWERKLRRRNPWIKPDGSQLNSWAECVLVFAARVKSWPRVDNIDKMELEKDREPAQCESVVAVELKNGESLSSGFQGMMEHDEPHCSSMYCEQYHCPVFNRHLDHSVNLWTQELSAHHRPAPELILSDETYSSDDEDEPYHMLRYKDVGMVLPKRFCPRRITSIKERPGYILVNTSFSTSALLSRDNPHIDSGILLEDHMAVPDMDTYLFEEVYMTRAELSDPPDEYRYTIADFNSKEMQVYANASTPNEPVAHYNGLIWWSIDRTHLVPTFIDLENPGEVYYSPKKAITVPIHLPGRIKQGSKSRNCSQFLFGVRHQDSIATVVNLATGIVTPINKPRDEPEGKVIPGFQNGQFYPRYLSLYAVKCWDLFTAESTQFDDLW